MGVMPHVNFADPRLLAPNYSEIIPNVNRGLATYGNLQQIADDATARPIKQKLQQIQLEEAMSRLQQLPIERQLQQLRLAQLSQPIERVVDSGIEEVPRYAPIQSIGDDGETILEQPAGVDVFSTDTIEVIDPKTGAKTTVKRRGKPLTTMEQAAAATEREMIARDREASLASARQGRLAVDLAKANSPDFKRGQSGTDSEGRLVTVYFNSKTGEQITIPTDLAPITTVPAGVQMMREFMGGDAPPNLAVPASVSPKVSFRLPAIGAAPVAAAADAVALDDAAAGLNADALAEIDRAVAAFQLPSAVAKASGPIAPKTKAEYDALPPGTEYLAPDGKIKRKK